jgi:hypothetical protein
MIPYDTKKIKIGTVPKRLSQFPTGLERFYQVIGDCQGYFGKAPAANI